MKVKEIVLERKFRLAEFEMFVARVTIDVEEGDVLDEAFYKRGNKLLFDELDAHLKVERERDEQFKAEGERLLDETGFGEKR